MKISMRLLAGGLILGSVGVTLLTTGKQSVTTLQTNFQSDLSYSGSIEGARTDAGRQNREGLLAFDLLTQKGCTPIYGLNPKRDQPGQPFFVSVPLRIGAIATIGGQVRTPFATGTLLCDDTGQVARVGEGGRIESPIPTSLNRNTLPIVPQGNRPMLATYLQQARALVDNRQAPQAVISTEEELINDMNRNAPTAAPVMTPPPAPTPVDVPPAAAPQPPASVPSGVPTLINPAQNTGLQAPPPIQ